MRRSTLALLPLVLAAALMAPACSGDDSASTTTASKQSEERSSDGGDDSRAEEIGQTVVNSDSMDTVTSDMQTCVGRAFIDGFGSKAESVAKTADDNSDDLTDAQLEVLTDALDECIPGKAFATFYMATVYDQAGLGDPDPAAVSCLTDAVDGKVGQVAAAFNSSEDPPAEFMSTLDSCVPTSAVAGLVAKGLQQVGGTSPFTAAQVTCISEAVAARMSFSDLSKGDSQALQGLIQEVLPNCPA